MQSKAPTTTQSKADDPKVLVIQMQHTVVLHLSCHSYPAERVADALAPLITHSYIEHFLLQREYTSFSAAQSAYPSCALGGFGCRNGN